MNEKIIMIVEDEDALSECLEAILNQFDFPTMTASNAETAMQMYQENQTKIALILADVGLPDKDGIELFYLLKAINPDIKYILMSGLVDPAQKEQVTKDGVLSFLQKPYRINEIIEKVKKVLE